MSEEPQEFDKGLVPIGSSDRDDGFQLTLNVYRWDGGVIELLGLQQITEKLSHTLLETPDKYAEVDVLEGDMDEIIYVDDGGVRVMGRWKLTRGIPDDAIIEEVAIPTQVAGTNQVGWECPSCKVLSRSYPEDIQEDVNCGNCGHLVSVKVIS